MYSLQYLLQRILREEAYIEKMMENGLESMASEKPTESMRYAMTIIGGRADAYYLSVFSKVL